MTSTKPFVVGETTYQVPNHWSDNAVIIFIDKYCRSYHDVFKETTVAEVFQRLVKFWTNDNQEQKELFDDLWGQVASPNSPQYFNAGIYKQYGVFAISSGMTYADDESNDSGKIVRYSNLYKPQLHACFIQPVNDTLESIGKLLNNEVMLFSRGSGTGTNFSFLRGKGEKLRGGGASSGLIAFLKAFDAMAGAIKSGGTTRRAAKMVVVDIDHPDIAEFIDWKVHEENKAKILIEGGLNPSWEGEAYQTVSGQNSNNSVLIPDKFMVAVKQDQPWLLEGRVDKSFDKKVSAKKLWWQLCEAAWRCADPGVQFTDTINAWNTTPSRGRIRASNPCSEHLRLDNSACNLASINLEKFLLPDNTFAVDRFVFTVRRWIDVLDRSVDLAGYPTHDLAVGAYMFRDIGLGYCNLGSLLMRSLIPYGSKEGRTVAAAITSLMTAVAYARSTELARQLKPYPRMTFDEHKKVVNKHFNYSKKLKVVDSKIKNLAVIIDTANEFWGQALERGKDHGYRNAQLTVIAPTGTIGITMDAETTGIEPLYDAMVTKTLAGGGTIIQSADCFKYALNIYGARSIETVADNDKHIFATAVSDDGGAILTPQEHVDMVAAVQPFVSGGISKTVNLPSSATIDDVDRIYRRAHGSGVKCMAVYRDGAKSQPLNAMECKTCGDDVCEV